jgi:hypothetical protein
MKSDGLTPYRIFLQSLVHFYGLAPMRNVCVYVVGSVSFRAHVARFSLCESRRHHCQTKLSTAGCVVQGCCNHNLFFPLISIKIFYSVKFRVTFYCSFPHKCSALNMSHGQASTTATTTTTTTIIMIIISFFQLSLLCCLVTVSRIFGFHCTCWHQIKFFCLFSAIR